MDIHFTCSFCKQPLVVDGTGAGERVNCPTCNKQLTIPRRAKSATTLQTSEELALQCRDMVYALRLSEAKSLNAEAGSARAMERGYAFNGGSSASGQSPEEMIEAARFALRQLRGFTAEEEQELLGAIIYEHFFGNRGEEFLVVTLGSNVEWPDLHTWSERFKEKQIWPRSWEVYPADSAEGVAGFYEKHIKQTTNDLLGKIHSLSISSRRVLLDGWLGWATPTRVGLTIERFDSAVEELTKAGLATREVDLPINERLSGLSMERLREIQKAHAVKGARSKDELIRNLLQTVEQNVLAEKLSSEPYARLDVGYRQMERYWFEYARARLLQKTIHTLLHSYRNFHSAENFRHSGLPRGKFSVYMVEDCPICAQIAKDFGQQERLHLERMPPFHPGCSCSITEAS